MKKFYILFLVILFIVVGTIFVLKINKKNAVTPTTNQNANIAVKNQNANISEPAINTPANSNSNVIAEPTKLFADPVTDFKARVTKKPFGIYITPATSPVQPEKFTGYHTGADAEYQDISVDVPVYAFTNGNVVLSRTASGYGGVFMIEFDLNGTKHTALYGHIRPSSLPVVGQNVTKGETLALLGTSYSTETDGERRNLHFTILSNNRIDLLGYVQTKSALSGWLDPLTYF